MSNKTIAITIITILINTPCSGMYSFFKKQASMDDVRQRPWAYREKDKEALRKKDIEDREKQIQARVQRLKNEGKTDREIDSDLLFNVYLSDTPEKRNTYNRLNESMTADVAHWRATRASDQSPASIASLERTKEHKTAQFLAAVKKQDQTPERKSWPYKPENYQNKPTWTSWWSNLWSSRAQTSNKNFVRSTPTNTQQPSTNWFSRWWYGR